MECLRERSEVRTSRTFFSFHSNLRGASSLRYGEQKYRFKRKEETEKRKMEEPLGNLYFTEYRVSLDNIVENTATAILYL